MPTERPGKWMGEWFQRANNGRHFFMLCSSTTFEIGVLEGRGGPVNFVGILDRDFLTEEDEEGDVSEITTPSRSSRKWVFDSEPTPLIHNHDPIHAEANTSKW